MKNSEGGHISHVLFLDAKHESKMDSMGAPYNSTQWALSSTDPETVSSSNMTYSSHYHRYTHEALLAYCSGKAANIGLMRCADFQYVAVTDTPQGKKYICECTPERLFAGIYDPNLANDECELISGISSARTEFNSNFIRLCYICILADRNREKGLSERCITWELLEETKAKYQTDGEIPEKSLRLICDDLFCSLQTDADITAGVMNGNIDRFDAKKLKNREYNHATYLCGDVSLLRDEKAARLFGTKTIAAAKAQAMSYTDTLHWSPEEELLIPEMPEDMLVPVNVEKILNRFLTTVDSTHPLLNPCWRGITGIGKSTGVKILACILHTPLLMMTCSTTTETEDFLSKHVPNTVTESAAGIAEKLPCYEDLCMDPEYAFELLTGEIRESVSGEELMEAYCQAAAKEQTQAQNPFKVVESDFIRALKNGYICEVQEFSRIRDGGTLVGLNNFNEPGALIPLVDGSHCRRHPHAMVVWTDNVGYSTCRRVDPSVIRRFSYVMDSTELEKEWVLQRVRSNYPMVDEAKLENMYTVWERIGTYCHEQDIDEGECSVTELESWVQLAILDGYTELLDSCTETIIGKLTSDPETRIAILSECVSPVLKSLGLEN